MNFVISVIKPEAVNILCDIYSDLKVPLTVTLHGRGTANGSMLELLGIDSNERRILMTFADSGKTAKLISAQKRLMHIGVPGHGITVAVPVKSVGGRKAVSLLYGSDRHEKYTPPQSYAYELIVAIANEGSTDAVMNAARHAGARGGTVLHGKGSAGEGDEKFLNISIAEEKEVILILSASENKSAIMRSVLEIAGPDSKAGTVLFSLPVSEVAGFGLLEGI